MTWEAVDTILDKAWECDAHACIETEDSKLVICKGVYEWKTYDTLDVLCVYSGLDNKEHYFNVGDIKKITIIYNDPRRYKTT